MDFFSDDEITRRLRLKRYEQPPSDYFENFLQEFRRRQRDELLRQPLWRICFERAEAFALRFNIHPLACAGIALVVACAGVTSVRLYQQPDTTQLAVQRSPVPTFDMQPTLFPGSRAVPLLPVNSLHSAQFISLELESESLDDQFSLEK
jgi:hypothetical protein